MPAAFGRSLLLTLSLAWAYPSERKGFLLVSCLKSVPWGIREAAVRTERDGWGVEKSFQGQYIGIPSSAWLCCKVASSLCFLLSFFLPGAATGAINFIISILSLCRTWQLSILGIIGWWCPEVQEIVSFSTSGATRSLLCSLLACSFAYRLGKHWFALSSRFQT